MTAAVTDAADAELEHYWQAISVADEAAATQVALQLLEQRPFDEVLDRLVVRAQHRVGDLWAANHLTVAREHAVTAVNESVVRTLGRLLPEPTNGPVLLVACVEREWHSLSVRVITETLRSWGFRAHGLGASASPETLISQVVDLGPRAVLLSASLTSSFPRARRVIEAVRGTGTPVILGGRAFDTTGTRARRLGATAYAATPGEVVDLLRTLPRHVTAAPALRHPAALEARSIVTSAETISAEVVTVLAERRAISDEDRPLDHWWAVLTAFVPHVVDALAGALMVEDPALMDEQRAWLADVLGTRDGPDGLVGELLEALADRLSEYPAATELLQRR